MKLDDSTIAKLELPPGKSDAIFFDDEHKKAVTGLGVRLRAGCRPVWIYQYRVGAKQRRYQIGPVAKLKAAKAREKAEELQAQVTLGKDPQAVKADAKAERIKKDAAAKHTVGALIEAYIDDREKSGELRPSSLYEIKRYLHSHWKPLHKFQVDDVERVEIAALLRTITKKNGATAAARARSALQSFFAWAMAEGFSLANASPVIGTRPPKTAKPRDRVLDAGEIAQVWKACRDDDYGRIVKLLLLTGCRRAEIGGLRWSEIEDGLLKLPAERVKNGLPHAVPLTPLALEIIEVVPRRADRDLLFGVGPRGFYGWHVAHKALEARIAAQREEAGLPPMPEWHTHDLRRTAATRMGDIGVQPHVVEAALNHQSGVRRGVAGVYNRSAYEKEVKLGLALWADHVRAIVEGGERKVVPFHAHEVA